MGGIGARLTRLEDPPLLRGEGRYAADMNAPGQLHLRVVRSDVELAAQVNGYLADRTLDREGRRRLLGSRLRLPLGRASVRALETLQRIGAAPRLRRPA